MAKTFEALAEVTVVLTAYDQATARTADGRLHLAITRHTAGVSFADVREGQTYLLTVTHRFFRVLQAQLVKP